MIVVVERSETVSNTILISLYHYIINITDYIESLHVRILAIFTIDE
jgi:hypothetical protein